MSCGILSKGSWRASNARAGSSLCRSCRKRPPGKSSASCCAQNDRKESGLVHMNKLIPGFRASSSKYFATALSMTALLLIVCRPSLAQQAGAQQPGAQQPATTAAQPEAASQDSAPAA